MRGLLRRTRRAGAVVLLYHRVCELARDPHALAVSPRRFESQLEVLRRRFRPLALAEAVERAGAGTLPKRAVSVTFDDGYADVLHTAKPVLERHQVPATVFAVSGQLGSSREFWWDELERLVLGPVEHDHYRHWNVLDPEDPSPRQARLRALLRTMRPLFPQQREELLDELRGEYGADTRARPGYRALTEEELCRVADGEELEVGSHTITHPLLSARGRTDQLEEISGCRRRLEEVVGRPVEGFSYPFGAPRDYTPTTLRLVRAAGFRQACANLGGPLTATTDPLQVPRLMVLDWEADEFEWRVERAARG